MQYFPLYQYTAHYLRLFLDFIMLPFLCLLTRCQYRVSDTQLTVKACVPLVKEKMHFHYMTYLATPKPCLKDDEIYNMLRPFLGHHYNTISLSEPCPGVERKIKKKRNTLIVHLLPQINPHPPLGCGVMKFTTSYSTDAT